MHHSLNIGGKIIELDSPKVMGILNVTPDSFYGASRVHAKEEILSRAEEMVDQGAFILDIGGQSTRPNAENIALQEELDRVIPAIQLVKNEFDVLISIDTFQSEVAAAAVQAGAHIVNDVTAGEADEHMIPTVAQLKVPYIAMHMQGKPSTMQDNPQYDQVTTDIFKYLNDVKIKCRAAGILDLIIDPGFGFGKTIDHNYQLLKELNFLQRLDLPMLVGLSRKSMIYKVLNTDAEGALNGTTALHMHALAAGALILRVHDVKEAMECVMLYSRMNNLILRAKD